MSQSSSETKGPSPKISIGVPVYNGGDFIEDCLESIKKQTFGDWECVIVNNRSTDNTLDIVKKYTESDVRFRLFDFEEFVSLEKNWNRLYPQISKDSIYFKVVQADDIIYPESLADMVDSLDKHPEAGMCTSYRIDGIEVNCDGLNYFDGSVFSGKDLLYKHLKGEIDISGSVTTPLFRKSALEKLPTFPNVFDETDYHLDTLLFYEMMNIADVSFVYKVLSITRWHEDAGTVTTAIRLRTFLCGKENRLFRFKHISPDLEYDYRIHRYSYAYTLFKASLSGNKDCTQWHGERLLRKFSFKEYLLAVLLSNGLTWRLLAPFRRKQKKQGAIILNS